MMKRTTWAGMAVAGLTTFAALPALAITMQAVYTGTITGSTVVATDFFGLGEGVSLTGEAMTMTYRYDTTVGSLTTSSTSSDLKGGTNFGVASPLTYVAVTINGVTKAWDTSSADWAQVRHNDFGIDEDVNHYFEVDGSNYSIFYMYAGDGSFGVPVDLTQPFTATYDAGNPSHYQEANFAFTTFDPTFTAASGSAAISQLVVSEYVAAPIPLPAAMPLFLAALGGLGWAARRRKAA